MPKRRRSIVWAPIAVGDLLEILDYVESESPSRARRLSARLHDRVRRLDELAERGRIVPELRDIGIRFLRELVVPPYRILYRIESASVRVLAVFDSRRDLADVLVQRALRSE